METSPTGKTMQEYAAQNEAQANRLRESLEARVEQIRRGDCAAVGQDGETEERI
jgi:hypothetical protein